jgi:hypothetical protein
MHRGFVTTIATVLAAGCCPSVIQEGDSCSWLTENCKGQGEEGCGLNGFRCEDGKWRPLYTYCNPPGPEPPPPAATPSASASGDVQVAGDAGTGADMQTLVGKPIAEVVAALGLDESTFHYRHEPPGKLRAIVAPAGDDAGAGEIELWLVYDSSTLFSTDAKWPLSRIGSAVVRGIAVRKGEQVTRYGDAPEGRW